MSKRDGIHEFTCLLCGKGRREIDLRRDPVTDTYFCKVKCWDRRRDR